MPREYASAGAFRRALEDRLNKAGQTEAIQINRVRRQVAFDRLLARLFRNVPAPWALKGGYAPGTALPGGACHDRYRSDSGESRGGRRDRHQSYLASFASGDWFEYVIGPPVMDLEAAPYGGARFPVEARMDSRVSARFHLDAGIGDAILPPVEIITCRDWLSFAGIAPARVATISREQQFAEKLHAYTLPRSSANSRVKDLVDLALLIGSGGLNGKRVVEAVDATFQRRRTHELPRVLQEPPRDWLGRFQSLVEECGIEGDMDSVFETVKEFTGRAGKRDLGESGR